MVKLLIKYKYRILFIISLILLEVLLIGGIGIWREYFWESVEKKDLNNFLLYLAEFAGMALGICLISGYTTYLISFVSLIMRTDLTKIGLSKDYHSIEGGEQRIQEDCFQYPFLAVTLLVNILRNILVFGTFAVLIIIQVGSLYLFIPVIYTVIGTLIAAYIAKPLISLNYHIQVVEAAFRRWIYAGIKDAYEGRFALVFETNKKLFTTTKKLNYFQSFYAQITVIVPYLILFPLYFSSKIVFGVFMQVASSMNHIIDSLSYIITAFNDINNWLSCRKRLQELGVINAKNK